MGQVLSFIRRFLGFSNGGSKATDQTPTNDDPKKLTVTPQQQPADSHSVTIYDPWLPPSVVIAGGNHTDTNIATPTTAPACTVIDLSRVDEDGVENKARDEPEEGVENEDEVVKIVVVVEEKPSKRKQQQKEFCSITTAKSGVSVKTSTGEKVGRIGPYTTTHRILLVGEGDFSFSASLAVAFGTASNMIATSFNSKEFLARNYKRSINNLQELKARGCMVLHEIDATEMANNSLLCRVKYDRIVFNFPLAGFFGRQVPRETQIRKNQVLLSMFLANAKMTIEEDGEIHITHKSYGFFRQWNLQALGLSRGLWLIEEVNFECSDYPGYHTKYGFGGDTDFDCSNSKTYKFRIANHTRLQQK